MCTVTRHGGRAAGRTAVLQKYHEYQSAPVSPGPREAAEGHEDLHLWLWLLQTARWRSSWHLLLWKPAKCEFFFAVVVTQKHCLWLDLKKKKSALQVLTEFYTLFFFFFYWLCRHTCNLRDPCCFKAPSLWITPLRASSEVSKLPTRRSR